MIGHHMSGRPGRGSRNGRGTMPLGVSEGERLVPSMGGRSGLVLVKVVLKARGVSCEMALRWRGL
jgi:hypothetical protein